MRLLHSAVPTQIVSRAMLLLNFLTISLLVDAVMTCSGSVCQDCQLPPACRFSRAAKGIRSGLLNCRTRNGNLTDGYGWTDWLYWLLSRTGRVGRFGRPIVQSKLWIITPGWERIPVEVQFGYNLIKVFRETLPPTSRSLS